MARPIKLLDVEVFAIRENKENLTNAQLAEYYHVSVPTISNVKARKGAYKFELKADDAGPEAQ